MAFVATRRDRFTSTKKQTVYYSDFPASMEKVAGSEELYKFENVDAVKNSIRNIILTNRGERFFNYDFGCDVRTMLFENIEPSTESAIKSFIETAITNFEPRAKLINTIVSGQPEINAYTVTIVFSTINSAEPQVLDLILTRVR
jgi:phage baseplate assembly protein W